ncbi:2438_t:CDS:1 [Cetraspora pellucida]|uniref:2438_t:CDS:1 n=1 Tax=Cetraspora pellucida TaxID=1433469 RepID=A0A9N8Z3R4_9GLOM|nr:2438_t:CDS:1 [Cetraspora pellucida]
MLNIRKGEVAHLSKAIQCFFFGYIDDSIAYNTQYSILKWLKSYSLHNGPGEAIKLIIMVIALICVSGTTDYFRSNVLSNILKGIFYPAAFIGNIVWSWPEGELGFFNFILALIGGVIAAIISFFVYNYIYVLIYKHGHKFKCEKIAYHLLVKVLDDPYSPSLFIWWLQWTYDFIMGGVKIFEWSILLFIGFIINACYDVFEDAYYNSAPRFREVVYYNDEEVPKFRGICAISYIRADKTQSTFVLAEKVSKKLSCKVFWLDALCINQEDPNDRHSQLVAMSEIYRQASYVIVLLEQSDFGYGPGFMLNKTAILNLKRWTQDVWTAQEHLIGNIVVFCDKNGSVITENNILALLEDAKQNGDIEAAEMLPIFYRVRECRNRRAVSLGDAWYLISDRLTDDPQNYIFGMLGILHPMIRHHFIHGSRFVNFEDGMQQILRLSCERGDVSWLHLVGKKPYSPGKCNLLVPTPGQKQHFDVEYTRSGASGWKIEYYNNGIRTSAVHGIICEFDMDKQIIGIENYGKVIFQGSFTLLQGEKLSLGMNVYLVAYLVYLYAFDQDDKFAIVKQELNGETHLIGTVKGRYSGPLYPHQWVSIA